MITQPFWHKPIDAFSKEEWEQLCDGCGLCCINKLEDEESGEVHYTNIACFLLDGSNGRCSDYKNRLHRQPACLTITPKTAHQFTWLPSTCAYRRVAQLQPLPKWHPLLNGGSNAAMRAVKQGIFHLTLTTADQVYDWEDQIIDIQLVED